MRRILWFRRDLRSEDNSLLSLEGEVFPIFIFDTNILDKLQRDDRRVALIYRLVRELKAELQALGLELKIFYGKPLDIFSMLPLEEFDEVVASGDYDAYAKERDREISLLLPFRYRADSYLLRPNEIVKEDKTPYLLFTPFYKKALAHLKQKGVQSYPKAKQRLYSYDYGDALSLEALGFNTQSSIAPIDIKKELSALRAKLASYAVNRDYLALDATSHLSVALRFGLVSVRELYRELDGLEGSEAFIRELLFREYYAYLLFHFPHLAWQNYKGRFNGVECLEKFERFCSATTGVPIVDAGVRELLQTGLMHNRVRMVVASFFTKDLLLPWQWGEAFFASHLLDYDAASNTLSWQWSAGTGIDAQPYFRVFNPYLQSKKFDKEGLYIKKWIEELSCVEAKYIHNESYLLNAEIKGYPKPMLEHKKVAKIAIESFKQGVYSAD